MLRASPDRVRSSLRIQLLDASITSACEGAVLIKPEEWIGYVENQQVASRRFQSRAPQEVTFDRLAGFIRKFLVNRSSNGWSAS